MGRTGCRSAYPTLEEAKKAAKPILVGRDGEIESFDPSEVMAKAYMSKNKKPEDDDKTNTNKQGGLPMGGPLAFLGKYFNRTMIFKFIQKYVIAQCSMHFVRNLPNVGMVRCTF